MTPSVTFLMAVHNGGRFLLPALVSIQEQSDSDWQMVVVDDASTDESVDLVRDLADPRIKLVCQPSQSGQTAALNRGLEHVSTDWVLRIDADDLAFRDRLSHFREYVKTDHDVVLLGAHASLIDENGSTVGWLAPPTDDPDIRQVLLERPIRNPFIHSCVGFRTCQAIEVGGYPVGFEMAEDYALWLLLARRGRTANLPTVDGAVRIHSAQKTSGRNTLAVYQQVLDAHRQHYGAAVRSEKGVRRGRIEVGLFMLFYSVMKLRSITDTGYAISHFRGELLSAIRHPVESCAVVLAALRSRWAVRRQGAE